jgi:tetratricopeptide (TPR) repeat protein
MTFFGYDPTRLKGLKPNCALIDTGKKLGTGFLIGQGRLLTCNHVMEGDTATCRFGDERSKLYDFRVVERYPDLDSAVLEAIDLSAFAGVSPLTVASTETSVDTWWGWGYPAVVDGQGVPLWGQVADYDSVGPDNRRTIQLFVENLVGSSAQLGGLSGSPMLIGDNVVGMIYRVLAGASDGQMARFGLIYAIPVGPEHSAIGGATAPHVALAPSPVQTEPTDQEMQQLQLFETLKNASTANSVLKLLDEWSTHEIAPMPANVPHLAAEKLLGMGAAAAALQVLDRAPRQTRAIQLSALAHSLLGEHDKARGLIATQDSSAESGGIVGGIYKRKYFETGKRTWLQGAFEEYERTYQTHPDPYPGINVAATALWLGKHDLSVTRAAEVRKMIEAKPIDKRSHWCWATLGEAAMLSGDVISAIDFYEKAVGREPGHQRDIAVMRRQARRNLDALKAAREPFEAVLTVGGVACFTGHRVDDLGRQPPRFPRERVGNVAARIKKALEDANVHFGFSSAAGGADIIFIEQLLARGGEPTVFLPFPVTDFANTSVGEAWLARFYAVLEKLPAGKLHILEAAKPADPELENAAYARCNAHIQTATVEAGRIYDEIPVLIAVLRRSEEEEKIGGTAEVVRHWEEMLSGPLMLIDPMEP